MASASESLAVRDLREHANYCDTAGCLICRVWHVYAIAGASTLDRLIDELDVAAHVAREVRV